MATQVLKKPNWMIKLAAGNVLSMVLIGGVGGHNTDWE